LIRSRVPCDILDEESLRRDDLNRYSLLILPNAACTGKTADDRLREFVRRGGQLLASFESSLCDEAGRREGNFRLADLFGIRLLRSPVKPYPHFYFFRTDDRPPVFSGIRADLLPAPIVSCEVAAEGAEVVSPFSIKFKGWDGSEILPSEFPAVTVHGFGQGRAVYLAGPFGEHYWKYKQPEIRMLLANLCRWLSPPVIEVEDARNGGGAPADTDGRRSLRSSIMAAGLTRRVEPSPGREVDLRIKTSQAPRPTP